MSCNGCRVLRKGCSEQCMLRQGLQFIDSPQAQGHATLFVAKFFGRAGLLSFVSAVPEPQRPALFQSLLFEAVGRTINPVGGAVGLISTGNWRLCQSAVDTVLSGGALHPLPEFVKGDLDRSSDYEADRSGPPLRSPQNTSRKRRRFDIEARSEDDRDRLDPSLISQVARGMSSMDNPRRSATPGESETTITTTASACGSGSPESSCRRREVKLLRLFV